MCNLKPLHRTEQGYIANCEQCNQIQMVFGTNVVVMDRNEFQNFRSSISRLTALNQNNLFAESKSIVLPTPCPQVYFLFTQNQVEELLDLLNQASLMLEANEILCAIKNNEC
ncbi:MAG: hypothetical protein IT235_03145 [Bacteroidia bacterium]|nr:hypothetical protein [Bacteroidia bacterium]